MITVTLVLPHLTWKAQLPEVPRPGDDLIWKDARFTVTSVDSVVDPGTEDDHVFVDLQPADLVARKVMEREAAEDHAKALLAEAKANGRTGQIVLVQASRLRLDEVPGVELSDLAGRGEQLEFMTPRQHPEIHRFFKDMHYFSNFPDVRIYAFPAGEYQVPNKCESDTFDVLAEDVSTIREAIAKRKRRGRP
ncbi:hypothetical protein [Streptomyces phaeochromogenes]|uniref:hypothetical protein n=1 Tax=Streptomyces phaeochromogenes TaxID=1923 RepID=UPI002DDB93BA|nr:hypothetical protein [Streptomyces phaeochromogenes]WRZ34747.1 hypothetical protein OG931_46950 [Streptomyces phaeochromogenes]